MKGIVLENWRPTGEDTTGDDNIGGIGLFEDELPAVQKSALSTNKRDPKTRKRRPQSEWTVWDVATEFSFQLGKRFPHLPGLINVREVAGALRGYRSKYGTTAVIENELMRMFFADEHNLKNASEESSTIHRKYLNMFKTHMNRAYENLGFDTPKIDTVEDVRTSVEYIYATDGTEFVNSLIGRKQLAQYEAGL